MLFLFGILTSGAFLHCALCLPDAILTVTWEISSITFKILELEVSKRSLAEVEKEEHHGKSLNKCYSAVFNDILLFKLYLTYCELVRWQSY